jgi:protein kinase A
LSKRYGNLKNGVADIKKHRYLNAINLNNLLSKKISPPYRPNVKGEDDVSNFGVFEDSMKKTIDINPDKDPFINGL